jgi:hypothetical protein
MFAKHLKSSVAIFVFAVLSSPASAQNAAPDPTDVLSRFLGDWTTQTKITRTGPPERVIEARGTATCQATLEGNYFEFRAATVPPGESDLQIMTYDAGAKLYRQWVFSSDGYRHEATGIWDAATSVLTWTGTSGTQRFIIRDHWVSPDRLEWNLRRTDSSGKLLQTIEGTVERGKSINK